MANPTIPAAPVTGLPLPADRAGRTSPRLVSLRVRLGMLLGTVAALAVSVPTLLHVLILVSQLEAGSSDEARTAILRQLGQAGLFAVGAFALALLVGLTVARRVTEPLLTLLKAMRSIRCDEGEPSLPRSSTTELAWLADELGAMRSALDGRTAAMRQALDSLAQDVGARQAVEAALRASEARYRSVVESAREIVFQIDAEGRWTFLNPAWTELTEYTIDEALGQPFIDYVHPDDRSRIREEFEEFNAWISQEASPGRRTEARYLTRSGGTRWLEGYASVMFGEDGQVRGTSGRADGRHRAPARRGGAGQDAGPRAGGPGSARSGRQR